MEFVLFEIACTRETSLIALGLGLDGIHSLDRLSRAAVCYDKSRFVN